MKSEEGFEGFLTGQATQYTLEASSNDLSDVRISLGCPHQQKLL
jgi:hypothetical protein